MTWNQYHEKVAAASYALPPTLVHIPTDLLAELTERARICAVNFQYNNIFDNTAAREDLGFHYTIPFHRGARRVVTWLESQGRIQDSDADPLDDQLIAAWEQASGEMVRSFQ